MIFLRLKYHSQLVFLVFKDEEFTKNIVENNNKYLSNESFDGIDHFDIVIDKLAYDLWEASDKDKSQ